MTINSENRVAGPFPGTGVSAILPFTFKVFQASDVVVISTDALGVDTVLTTGFTTFINADQNVSPGGTVTITQAVGAKTTLTSAIAYLQPTQLTNNGGFYPTVINDALDRLTILMQQVFNATARSLKIPVSDGTAITTNIPGATLRANKVLAFDASGNLIPSNLTLAQIESVTTSAAAAAATATTQAGLAQGYATTATNAMAAAQTAQAAAEAAAAGMKWRPSVKASTTGALPTVTYANGASGVGATLTATVNGALASQDGIALAVNDRLLVKDQAASLQNGVYTVTQLGTGGAPFILTRAVDGDTWPELVSQVVAVEQGTTNQDKVYICTVDQGGTIGTTAVAWASLTSGYGSITPFRLVAGVNFNTGDTVITIPVGGLLMFNMDGVTQNSNDFANDPNTGIVTLTSGVPVGVTQISGAVISVLSIGTPGAGTVDFTKFASGVLSTQVQAEAGTNTSSIMSPLRVFQAIAYYLANVFSKSTCKAWVKFNSGTGVIAVLDSYNVSSVVRNAAGDYTINFTTPLTNANYTWAASGQRITAADDTNLGIAQKYNVAPTTGALRIVMGGSGGLNDCNAISVQVFGS